MALAQNDIEQIQGVIKEVPNNNVRYELSFRERIIWVKKTLKHQRKLMIEGIEQLHHKIKLLLRSRLDDLTTIGDLIIALQRLAV